MPISVTRQENQCSFISRGGSIIVVCRSYSAPEHHLINPCPVPSGTLLDAYARSGAYTDCYVTDLRRAVSQARFVEAFYSSAIFRIGRWLIGRLMSRPSSDAEARLLGEGRLNAFAAWSVEGRTQNQLLLAAGRTRSWLMVTPIPGDAGPLTRLYFGSAVIPRKGGAPGGSAMGWQFRVLLGFHRAYSRVLLRAACRRLMEG